MTTTARRGRVRTERWSLVDERPRRRARRRVRQWWPTGGIDGRGDRRLRRVSYPGTTGRIRLVQALFDALGS